MGILAGKARSERLASLRSARHLNG